MTFTTTFTSTARACGTVAAAAVGLALIGFGAPGAQAEQTRAAEPCGYLGMGEYNHCGTGTVAVDVDQWNPAFPSSLYCVGPGITDLDNHSTEDWGVYYASYAPGYEGCRPGAVWVP
ncbi:DUF6355 family natural product biosynthesis protein [Streptomonospora sp. S1-112]|uniref:DUF6355 family natural product biosynthesis protein n=1 Tax=Streptomonospora mangrovi TaxID=2883123 RepID=A0A9X3NRC2_9ACTN|nr:DUF6355 family natural product biosynthesis protein [Streptomonospora mangrovi]MDA0567917.1 DUF6355 family natural product biosynthesis protein [Streptomonospora mangrovi]